LKHSCLPLPPIELSPTFFPVPYILLAIVAEYDNTTVHPNGCGDRQPDRTAAGTIYIGSGVFPSNRDEANLYSFPLSGFLTALAVTPANTPPLSLMA
jgi:hypothetical protein